MCQTTFEGVEGPRWESTYHTREELHQAANCQKSGGNKKAEALWALQKRPQMREWRFVIGAVCPFEHRLVALQ